MSRATRELLRTAFPRGCRVRRSAKAVERGVSARVDRGVVAGHGRELLTLVVRRDGRKMPDASHWSWWERDDAAPPATQHTTVVVRLGREFRYRCSCGKTSRSPTSRWRARRNARAHRRTRGPRP